MPAFTKGATYDGMMRNFAEIFGDDNHRYRPGKKEEIKFGQQTNGII